MMKFPVITSLLMFTLGLSPLAAQVDMDLDPDAAVAPITPVEKGGRTTYAAVAGNWVDNNTDGTLGGALRLGWNFAGVAPYYISTDVEVEASYWQVDSEVSYGGQKGKAKTKNLPAMVNLRVNVPLSDTGLFLYGGGGAGVSYIDISGTGPQGQSVNDTGAVFTYGFSAGIGVHVNDRVSIRAGYRSLWLTDDSFNDGDVEVKLSTERNDIFELAVRLDL